jgi:hypothetical protein
LGEDRFLTTLMLKTFPQERKLIFVPAGHAARPIVPHEFRVLLSQRRRWINSTIHNLLELVLVPGSLRNLLLLHAVCHLYGRWLGTRGAAGGHHLYGRADCSSGWPFD